MTIEEDAGAVRLTIQGPVATLLFDRPAAHNAMTWRMYEEFLAHSRTLQEAADLRVVILRGAGGKAFIAGSDIAQFSEFKTGADGVDYERKMEIYLSALVGIPVPTLAVIEGFAIGGGLNIAACCDIRIATPAARFGVPIARTIGNCLSLENYGRIVAGFGEGRAKRMLLLGDLLDAEEARQSGFVTALHDADDIDEAADKMVSRMLANAPLTLRASKAAIGRVLQGVRAEAEDLIASCYGSADFREGVAAFVEKRPARWEGR